MLVGIGPRSHVARPSIMQPLYESKINVAVTRLWDGGFYVKLDDEMNGF